MGVFSRFKDIVNANINALLDKAEDPEKMLKLMMQEMEDTLIELKSSCAARMAAKIRLEKRIAEQTALVGRWQSRAQMAIEKNRDDLARDALIEKRRESEVLSSLQNDIKGYDSMIDEARGEIDQLEAKLSQARSKLKLLQEKQKAAREKSQMNSHMNSDPSVHFDNLEEKIDRLCAQNELNRPRSTTEETFRDMEEQQEIEKELEMLKKEMNR